MISKGFLAQKAGLESIMIWSSSFKALTECDSMVFPFILCSCFGALWLNRVLLPAASIIPVFMPVFIFLD